MMTFSQNTTIPYGLPIADEHYSSAITPYKYSGKEFDTMNGLNLYDFEARFHDPALCQFPKADPLAEDYCPLSPYLYCAANPILFVDPSGNRISIQVGGEIFYVRMSSNMQYEAYDSNMEPYTGNDPKILKILDALNRLKTGAFGASLTNLLADSPLKTIYIMVNDVNSFQQNADGMGNSIICWDPYSNTGGISLTTNGEYTLYCPSYINLAHELGHALNDLIGNYDESKWYNEYRRCEIFACYIENRVRAENGIPLRTHYSNYRDALFELNQPNSDGALFSNPTYQHYVSSFRLW